MPLIREYIPGSPSLSNALLPGGSYCLPPSIPLHLTYFDSLGQNPERNPANVPYMYVRPRTQFNTPDDTLQMLKQLQIVRVPVPLIRVDGM